MHSLKSDLPYAYNDPITTQTVRVKTAADRFAEAFVGAQYVIAQRMRMGWTWRLQELFKDSTAEHMKVVDEYLQPILEEAVRKNRAAIGKGKNEDGEGEDPEEAGTLLDHLVKLTDGEFVCDGEMCSAEVHVRRPEGAPRRDVEHHDRR